MLFSKKKKIQRDRKAGLVFRWRGNQATNRGGGTLALCLTSAVFAGGFLLLNVSAKPNIVPSRYRASIIQLGTIDDKLAWWIEKNSPSIPEWSSSADEESIHRVDELLLNVVNADHHRSLGFQELNIEPIERTEYEMYRLNDDILPPIGRLVNIADDINSVHQPVGIVKWNLEISVDGELNERLPKEITYDGWIPESWYGDSVKFSVAVDSTGKVLAVNPVDWTEDEIVKGFENWLYSVAFKPLKKIHISNTVIGVIEFGSVSEVVPPEHEESIEAKREEQP